MTSLDQARSQRRSDAERNRAAIVEAFIQLLATDGADVPMSRVAQQAGPGQGRLYRHSPERALLAFAVYESRRDRLAELATAHADDRRMSTSSWPCWMLPFSTPRLLAVPRPSAGPSS